MNRHTDQYLGAVDEAHRRGVRVWLEADLVRPWLAGPVALRAAVRRLGELARQPGVVGVKFTDRLGVRGEPLVRPAAIRRFLTETGTALAAAAPGRIRVLDLAVPELGCLPDDAARPHLATVAAARLRGRYPQMSIGNVDGYLRLGVVDVVQVDVWPRSDATYAGWGVDADGARRAAWTAAVRYWGDRGVHGRVELAHPGRYPGDADTAEAELGGGVDAALAAGVAAVDVGTWRHRYQGWVARLADPGPRTNPLVDGLRVRHAAGARLFAHFDPWSVERVLAVDLAMLATTCRDVYIAVSGR